MTTKTETIIPAAMRRHFVGLVEQAILWLGIAEVRKIVAAAGKRK